MPKNAISQNSSQIYESCSHCPVADNCPVLNTRFGAVPSLPVGIEEALTFPKGKLIFQAGVDFRGLYIIQSGSVKIYSISEQGDEQITSFHGPGEIIGLDGIADSKHMSFAQTLESTTVCCLNLERVLKVAAKNETRFFLNLLRILSEELYARKKHIMVIAKLTAEQRVASFLIKLSERQQELHCSELELRLPMTRYEIGNYLALTVETVSRIFSILQKKEIIEVNGRYIQILQPETLKNITAISAAIHTS